MCTILRTQYRKIDLSSVKRNGECNVRVTKISWLLLHVMNFKAVFHGIVYQPDFRLPTCTPFLDFF